MARSAAWRRPDSPQRGCSPGRAHRRSGLRRTGAHRTELGTQDRLIHHRSGQSDRPEAHFPARPNRVRLPAAVPEQGVGGGVRWLLFRRPVRFDVRPDLAVTEFVAAFMRSDTFLNRASIVTTTGQLPRIGTEEIAAVPIELPPLDVQQRVSSELGERLGSAERARRASQERLAAVRALSAAYLREVFEGRSAAGWRTVALEDLVQTPIRTGLSKPARPDSATRCLTLSAVRGRTLILEESKPVDVADDDAERNRLRPGCFYVVRGNGNRELVGRGSFAPDIVPDGILFPDLLFEVNLSGAVDRSFFWCQWSSPAVRDALSERARTAAGIYKINTVGLRSMRLRLPDLAEQRQVAHGLLKRIDEAATLQSACCDEAKLLDALRPALLRACFDGGA